MFLRWLTCWSIIQYEHYFGFRSPWAKKILSSLLFFTSPINWRNTEYLSTHSRSLSRYYSRVRPRKLNQFHKFDWSFAKSRSNLRANPFASNTLTRTHKIIAFCFSHHKRRCKTRNWNLSIDNWSRFAFLFWEKPNETILINYG